MRAPVELPADIREGAPDLVPAICRAAAVRPLLLVGGGLLLLAVLTACYVASEIVLPIALAFLLMLVLRPAMRLTERWHIPRIVAALALLALLFGVAAALATVLERAWRQDGQQVKLSTALPKLQEWLCPLLNPLRLFRGSSVTPSIWHNPSWVSRCRWLPSREQNVPQRLLGVIGGFSRQPARNDRGVVLSVDVRGNVPAPARLRCCPSFRNKRQAVGADATDRERYRSLISGRSPLMNLAVGTLSGLDRLVLRARRPDPRGTLAFLLNFVPVLGPDGRVAIFFAAGPLSFDTLWRAIVPAALYLAIHIIEGRIRRPGCWRRAAGSR